MALNLGDVVKLKSGGPDMTVINIIGTTTTKTENFAYHSAGRIDGDIVCQWFDKNKLESNVFKPEALEKVEKDSK